MRLVGANNFLDNFVTSDVYLVARTIIEVTC